ncbi:MAG: transcriptional regulator [Geminicoccaceae bacterium]|nr:transcriptional regulator [Geminicoccaceae bacterium]
MSEWMAVLRDVCDRHSQAWAAKRIGYSDAVVSGVLKGKYKGDIGAVQKAVEGAFMASVVECPALGPIAANRCLREQREELRPSNPQRVKIWRACRSGCVHSRLKEVEAC